MFPEGNVWSTGFILFLLTTGVSAEKICSVHSNDEVHMGSSFEIRCIFKKECSRLIYQDEVSLNYSSLNSTVLILSIVNLSRTTTFTCKCHNEPEPCGTDIVPGYPPAVPQNLTCFQDGEFGKVNCTWKTGWETHVKTTSHLWVKWAPPVRYESVAVHDGARYALFPVSDIQSHFSVWVHAINSLGSVNSTVLNFTLNEIVKPLSPKITNVECSSRHCQLYPYIDPKIQLVEIRYKKEHDRWNTISFNNTHLATSWNITSLLPYSKYTFAVRWKLGPERGLWSEWTKVMPMTDEEAPVTMIDAWYIDVEEPKSFQLFWKKLNNSEARGQIVKYIVTGTGQGFNKTTDDHKNTTKVSCFLCNVSISAMNSKGLSPPRFIQLQRIARLQYKELHTPVNNHTVALNWPKPTDQVTEFVVEWFPVGQNQQLQWIRLEGHRNTMQITGLHPAICYEVAVSYLHSSMTKQAIFSRISTVQRAPQDSPVFKVIIDAKSDSVEVKWNDIPVNKRGGCLENYTIYLNDSANKMQKYSVPYTQREFTISGLTPGQTYTLWVSAWTTAGQSPVGHVRHVTLKQSRGTLDEKPVALLISVGIAVFLICLCLFCLCQFSLVQRRLSECCHCLMPSIVPDPANSKWAKECAREKGEMNLKLQLSDSSMSEEEPDTVEVEECPQEKIPNDKIISTEETLPLTSNQHNATSCYLKSISIDSNNSDTTQASRSTDSTEVYISPHGGTSGGEVVFPFFPCPNSPLLESFISIGGKLTLESVKIDCSGFLHMIHDNECKEDGYDA